MIEIIQELIPDTWHLKLFRQCDSRGAFTKTFHAREFHRLGIDFTPRESCYTSSARGVVRGMHFQLPPHAHQKLVHCCSGRVLDVLLDLRINSPSYGKTAAVELSSTEATLLCIPAGVAHGFAALGDENVLMYQTDEIYYPESDAGIRWDSFGFAWPVEHPVISARDQVHPALRDFDSPFQIPSK
jgi:dTDP-4-dehydrorhamnose 3,5-epimerase